MGQAEQAGIMDGAPALIMDDVDVDEFNVGDDEEDDD